MNQIIKSQSNDSEPLEVAVRRAQALLTEGDIDRARIVADSVYVRAKTEAEFARKYGAAAHLIDKARRLMADALIIESTSLASLADRVDAQQADGEILKNGRRRNDSVALTLTEAGLTRELLYRARRLRDCENAQPGIISLTINGHFSAGRMPSRAAILKKVRSSTDEPPANARLSTGVNVAGLHWYELEAAIRQHEDALAALRRVFYHTVPSDVELRVRDVIGPRRLAALIAGDDA